MGFARHPPGCSPEQCCRACKVSAEGEGPGQSRSVLRRKARQAQVPTAESREKLQAIASELQDSCCGAEHSCVHALQLLTRLGRHKHGVAPSPKVSRRPRSRAKLYACCWPHECNLCYRRCSRICRGVQNLAFVEESWNGVLTVTVLRPAGANFKRLAQQLEQYAAASGCGGSDVWRLQPWLQPSGASNADAEASALIAGTCVPPCRTNLAACAWHVLTSTQCRQSTSTQPPQHAGGGLSMHDSLVGAHPHAQ